MTFIEAAQKASEFANGDYEHFMSGLSVMPDDDKNLLVSAYRVLMRMVFELTLNDTEEIRDKHVTEGVDIEMLYEMVVGQAVIALELAS